jgi:predicted nucleic acid-binding protein
VGIGLNYLDTYALVEIGKNNPNYSSISKQDFQVCDVILCEFYGVTLRDFGKEKADEWFTRLSPYSESTTLPILIEAVRFRQENKPLNLSFWDVVGYMHARSKNGVFVTGDKGFEKLPHVKYIK